MIFVFTVCFWYANEAHTQVIDLIQKLPVCIDVECEGNMLYVSLYLYQYS